MRKRMGSILIFGLGVILVIRIGTNVVALYKTGGRLSEREERLDDLTKENRELERKLTEVQTPEYMEREAREKLGMGREGEIVVIIPEEEYTARTSGQQGKEEEEQNWIKWRKLYLGF